MSEYLPHSVDEPIEVPHPGILFSALHNYACTNDDDFRAGKTLAMETSRKQKTAPSLLEPDDNPVDKDGEDVIGHSQIQPLYDEKSTTFEASREIQNKKGPVTFVIGFELLTQLDKLPLGLLPHLSDEEKQEYGNAKPGDLQSLHSVQYTINGDGLEEVEINRDLAYALQDWTQTIISFSQEQRIPYVIDDQSIMSEPSARDSLHLGAYKKHPNQQSQRIFDREFEDIFDGFVNMEFYQELLNHRDAEATLCILSLLKSLRKPYSIPDIINQPPNVYPKEKSYRT